MISLENISRTYHVGGHSIHALRRVDLDIASGEFVAISPQGSSSR
jgi:ABC-type lipoprotein export system ATPase subunit